MTTHPLLRLLITEIYLYFKCRIFRIFVKVLRSGQDSIGKTGAQKAFTGIDVIEASRLWSAFD